MKSMGQVRESRRHPAGRRGPGPARSEGLETRIIRELDESCPRCRRAKLLEVEATGFDDSGEPYRFARCPKCQWAQPLKES
jgi:ssDNA-binding Zn-finger/Zn-ribbon topoisomerase 1